MMQTAGLSTYGVASTDWRSLQRALSRFGAKRLRSTGGHQQVVMELRSTQIYAGPHAGKIPRTTPVHVNSIKQLLGQVAAAGIPPMLFVAVVDNVGRVQWRHRPQALKRLLTMLRNEKPNLSTIEACRDLMYRFTSEETGAEIDEVHAVADDEPTQAEPIQAESTQDELPIAETHRYRISEIVSVLGLDYANPLRRRAIGFVAAQISGHHAVSGRLIDEGAIVLKAHGKVNFSYLNTHAVLTLAEVVQNHFGLAPETREEPQAAPEPTPAPPEPPQPRDEPQAPLSAADGLLFMCARLGVKPTWDGFGINVTATIVDLANTWRANGDPC
ncbi:MAG: hypothetical protein H0U69_03575 [Trueperaceae bacterium]|nr:hypothetical protein [Trueperaceae bacterium]